MSSEKWHTLNYKKCFEILDSNEKKGLTEQEVQKRREKYGKNEIESGKKKTLLSMFLSQFQDLLIIILILAAIISGFLGETLDAIAIIFIVVLNAIMSTIQEYRAEKALDAIKNMIAPKAKVIRSGEIKEVLSSDLVPGDVVILAEGDKVPADLRIFESNSLHINEAILTGESMPVDKQTAPCGDVLINDQKCMAFSNTLVTFGNGKGLVVSTGMSTEFGKIAEMLQTEEEQLPLQKNLDEFSKQLAKIILAICVIVFITGVLEGGDILEFFMVAVSLAVAAIPEGLPAIMTISLAAGVYKLAKKNAIIRKLPAVETLGSVSVICSDKTGTLTRNELSVASIYVNDKIYDVSGAGYIPSGKITYKGKEIDVSKENELKHLILAGVSCNNATLKSENGNWTVLGDPTEGALLVLAEKAKISAYGVKVYEIPFTSERKMMTVVYGKEDGHVAYSKGAPEVLLNLCSKIETNEKITKITDAKRKELLNTVELFAKKGQRVLAIAYSIPKCDVKNKIEVENIEKDLVLLGFVGIIDLPRQEAIEAIAKCKSAGIQPIMITGDHKSTATAIAIQMGLLDENHRVLTGDEIDKLSDEEFDKIINEIVVYARLSPQHKLKIVEHLKSKGYIVAMTGDGVNDAPAIKKADIGIAMGITGTDVVKESSRMILADDNFATIVSAVEGGRIIYSNIQNAIKYLLTCNFSEVLVIFIAILLNWPLPLVPIQILMMNLVTDGFPALALGMDPGPKEVMKSKPRPSGEKLLSKSKIIAMFPASILMTIITLSVFYINLSSGNVAAQTIAFTTLVLLQLVYSLSCRSEYSVLNGELFKNKYLLGAILISFSVQLAVVLLPLLQPLIKTTALNQIQWLEIIGFSMIFFVIYETIFKKLIK